MLKKIVPKKGVVLFPSWNVTTQSLQLWAAENGVFQTQGNESYQTHDEVTKIIQGICREEHIKASLDWGIRYHSCQGESLFLNFLFRRNIKSDICRTLINKLKFRLPVIFMDLAHYEFEIEKDLWVAI